MTRLRRGARLRPTAPVRARRLASLGMALALLVAAHAADAATLARAQPAASRADPAGAGVPGAAGPVQLRAQAQRSDAPGPVTLRIEAPPEIAAALEQHLPRPALAPTPALEQRVAARLERDALEIMRALGYFSATAGIDFETGGAIRVTVDPGALTTVRSVEIRFTGPIADPEYAALRARLQQSFAMANGAAFVSADWESAKRALLATARSDRFLRAELASSRASVDAQSSAARLELEIASGPPVRLGTVGFVGLERYPEPVLRALVELEPGLPYTGRTLREAQQVLQRTGWFSSVTVLPVPLAAGDEPSLAKVEIAVVERDRRVFTAGVGYSTDDGARAKAAIEDRNLLGRGLTGRAQVIWSETGASLGLSVREPYDRSGAAYGAQALLSRSRIQSEDVRALNLSAFRSQRVGEDETVLSLAYQLERRQLPATPAERFRALVPGIAWSHRALDDPLLPRSGYSLYTQVSGAARGILSDTSFVRGYARGLLLLPLSQRDLLLLRGEAGVVFARDGDRVPTENLFRTGGSLSVRGYEYQSLGIERSGAVVGGRVLAVASAELQHSLAAYGAPDFSLAAFVDAGDVADHYTDLRPVLGIGTGVRWRTPIGPVNFDLAYGRSTGRFRVHLTLGYAF